MPIIIFDFSRAMRHDIAEGIKGMLQMTSMLWFWRLVRTPLSQLWRIFRPAVRFIRAVLMLAALFALTADVTRWQIGDTKPWFHSIAYHINTVAPSTFKVMANADGGAASWNYGVLMLLTAPAWIIFALSSVMLAVVARERRPINIFIN